MSSSLPPQREQPQILQVRPPSGGASAWEIRADDTPKPISKHATEADAIALARMLSRKSGAVVHVYDQEGRYRALPTSASVRPPLGP
jgi:hypothetical protein